MNVSVGEVGIVSEIDAENYKVRVKWPVENQVSGWLFWLCQPGRYDLPEINQQALVLYDQYRNTGIALGLVLKDGDTDYNDVNTFGFKFAGIEIKINKVSGNVTVISNDNITVEAKNVEIKADEVKISKNLVVGGKSEFTGDVSAKAKIDASGVIKSAVEVQAGVIKLTTHTHNSAPPGSPTGPALPT